jgi:hypothetical protein
MFGDSFIRSNESVDYSSWDFLRKEGHVLGKYSCKGETVGIKKSGAVINTFWSGVAVLSTAFLASFVFCSLPFLRK